MGKIGQLQQIICLKNRKIKVNKYYIFCQKRKKKEKKWTLKKKIRKGGRKVSKF